MRTVIFCYADEDALLALEIGGYLERNLPLACDYEDGRIRSGFDLIDAVGRGLSVEFAIVLLSPDSMPAKWERQRWEGPLLKEHLETGSRVFFLQVSECKFPELLRRQAFVDFRNERTAALRQLKRAILRVDPTTAQQRELPRAAPNPPIEPKAIEPLWSLLADEPGVRTGLNRDLALHFAHSAADDFDGTFWIDCAGRTQAGVLGDTGHALGLRLSGAIEQNFVALQGIFSSRRSMLVYERLSDDCHGWVAFGGRASIALVAPDKAPPPMALSETIELFSNWPKDPEACLRSLRHAEHWLHELRPKTAESWRTIDRLGSAVFALLRAEDRLAEAYEILQILMNGAREQRDEDSLRRFQWSESWILGHWGEPYTAVNIAPNESIDPVQEPAQLGFAFF